MPKELFVGNLSRDVQKRDIEDVFDRYGKLLRCDIKDKGTLFNKHKIRRFQYFIIYFFNIL